MSLTKALEDHKKWLNGEVGGVRADLWEANLREADLRGANLRGANLWEADLREADLDFSVWPLWCGSIEAKVDRKLFVQLVYHLCAVGVDNEECKRVQERLLPLAKEFHRWNECPLEGGGRNENN